MVEAFPFLISVCRRVAKPACGLLAFLPMLLLSLAIEAGGEYSVGHAQKEERLKFPTITGQKNYNAKNYCNKMVGHLNSFEDEDIFLCELPAHADSNDVKPLDWEELDWDEAKARAFLKKAQAGIKRIRAALPPSDAKFMYKPEDLEPWRDAFNEFKANHYESKGKTAPGNLNGWRYSQRQYFRIELPILNLEFDYAFKLGQKAWSVRRVDATELPGFKGLSKGMPESQIMLYGFFIHYPYCKIRRLNDRLLQPIAHGGYLNYLNHRFMLRNASVNGCPYLQFMAYEWRYRDKTGKDIVAVDLIRELSGMLDGKNLERQSHWEGSQPEQGITEFLRLDGWSTPFFIGNQLYHQRIAGMEKRFPLAKITKHTIFKLIRGERSADNFYPGPASEEEEKWFRKRLARARPWDYEKYNSPDAEIFDGLVAKKPSALGYNPAVYVLNWLQFKAVNPVDYMGDDFADMAPIITAKWQSVCDLRYFSDDKPIGG